MAKTKMASSSNKLSTKLATAATYPGHTEGTPLPSFIPTFVLRAARGPIAIAHGPTEYPNWVIN